MKYSISFIALIALASAAPSRLDTRTLGSILCPVYTDNDATTVNVPQNLAPSGYQTTQYTGASGSKNLFNAIGGLAITTGIVAGGITSLVVGAQAAAAAAAVNIATGVVTAKLTFVQNLAASMRTQYGKNVCVTTSGSHYNFAGATIYHNAINYKCPVTSALTNYDVIVFDKGNYQLNGNGGFQNFAYSVADSCTHNAGYISCPGATQSTNAVASFFNSIAQGLKTTGASGSSGYSSGSSSPSGSTSGSSGYSSGSSGSAASTGTSGYNAGASTDQSAAQPIASASTGSSGYNSGSSGSASTGASGYNAGSSGSTGSTGYNAGASTGHTGASWGIGIGNTGSSGSSGYNSGSSGNTASSGYTSGSSGNTGSGYSSGNKYGSTGSSQYGSNQHSYW